MVRLQNALGWKDLASQIVLSEGLTLGGGEDERSSKETMNVLIGYNGSANSQIALDMALWIAHQTRLASQTRVLVHVVYIVDRRKQPPRENPVDLGGRSAWPYPRTSTRTDLVHASGLPVFSSGRRSTDVLASQAAQSCLTVCQVEPIPAPENLLDQADCILWQARCLAEEWRGSLEAHLRFGSYPDELLNVAREIDANLIVVGCSSPEHELVRQLAPLSPCPIWGIPHQLEEF
nr:universal stress protein [Leptolyngbya sp. FACHB-8]